MIKKIKYYYYYLFYNAYWTSFDIGEKTVPRQNAVYYMNVIKIFLWISIVNLLAYSEIGIPYMYLFIVGAVIVFLTDHYMFSKNVFKSYYDEYIFIKQKRKKDRLQVFWITFIISVTSCIATAGLNIDF